MVFELKYIQEYEKHGISIYAITVQNEPGVDNSQEIDPWSRYTS